MSLRKQLVTASPLSYYIRPPTFFTKVGKKLCSTTFHQYNNILRLPRPFRAPWVDSWICASPLKFGNWLFFGQSLVICLNPFLWSEGAGFVLAGFLDSQTWKNSPRSKESANIYPSYEINSEVQNLEILQKDSVSVLRLWRHEYSTESKYQGLFHKLHVRG